MLLGLGFLFAFVFHIYVGVTSPRNLETYPWWRVEWLYHGLLGWVGGLMLAALIHRLRRKRETRTIRTSV